MEAVDAGTPVSRRFMSGYTVAQVGAFIAFLPLLSILLPLKAQSLDPAGRAVLLSQIALWGAVAAGVGNITAGYLSDATSGRLGRRRPWIIGGALATALANGLIFWAPTPAMLLAAVVFFQVALNIMFSPLNALLPDRVPNHQKGLVSALMGLGHPAASLFTALVIGVLLIAPGSRFLAVSVTILALVLPFAIGLREPPPRTRTAAAWSLSLGPLADRDFRMAFLSRLFVQVTITLNMLYLLFFLEDGTDVGVRFPGVRTEVILGWLLVASTLASLTVGFAGGLLSDRLKRRKPFVIVGGLLMAMGTALLVSVPQWPGTLVAQVLFGAGLGLYSTVDIALVAQILPRQENAGRDLGVMNLAITLPQVAAPLLGMAIMSTAGGRLSWIFAASTIFALTGAVMVAGIRRAD
ncbi:MAG: MFS transporter [Caulobacter sp.]|nr:MFS transporter [Caulobacter sp.]